MRIKPNNLMDIQAKKLMSYKGEEIRLASNFYTMKYFLILKKESATSEFYRYITYVFRECLF